MVCLLSQRSILFVPTFPDVLLQSLRIPIMPHLLISQIRYWNWILFSGHLPSHRHLIHLVFPLPLFLLFRLSLPFPLQFLIPQMFQRRISPAVTASRAAYVGLAIQMVPVFSLEVACRGGVMSTWLTKDGCMR